MKSLIKNKKISTLIAIVLIAVIAISSVSAIMLITKNVPMSASIKTVGNIAVYQKDGITPLTALAFGEFTATTETPTIFFQVKNTGNVPLVIRISTSSTGWAWLNPPTTGSYQKTGSPFVWCIYTATLSPDTLGAKLLSPAGLVTAQPLAKGASLICAILVNINSIDDPTATFNPILDIVGSDV